MELVYARELDEKECDQLSSNKFRETEKYYVPRNGARKSHWNCMGVGFFSTLFDMWISMRTNNHAQHIPMFPVLCGNRYLM